MSQSIAPEDLTLNQFHAFTISPDMKKVNTIGHQFKQSYIDELDEKPLKLFDSYVSTYLKQLKNCKYILWTEISKFGRPHLHGFIKVLNWSFYIEDIITIGNMGIFKIDTIGGENYTQMDWHLYCVKNSENFKDYFNEIDQPILYTNHTKKKKKLKGIQRFL